MILVIDTIRSDAFQFGISNEILQEYEEVLGKFYFAAVGANVVELLLNRANSIWLSPSYKWNLIEDADDNRFVDCAIACQADYIITHDKHFKILEDLPFPKTPTLKMHELQILLDPK